MNKEQQIIEWFEKNDVNLYRDACSFGGLFSSVINNYILFKLLIEATPNMNNSDILIYRDMVCCYLVCNNIYFGQDYKESISLLRDTLIKKNRDYGNSFDKSIKKFGWIYLAIELDKKKNRLHSLLKSKDKPNYESIEDTLFDIAGYCILALIYIDNNKE